MASRCGSVGHTITKKTADLTAIEETSLGLCMGMIQKGDRSQSAVLEFINVAFYRTTVLL